jgi:uncharacterized RDD family membrane protein YckC
MDWFYAQNNQQNGPVTIEALVNMLQQGHVQPTDLVWRDGMASWQPAGTVPELSAGIGAPSASLGYFNPVVAAAGAPEYAGFWLRFAAALIDGILIAVVGFVLDLVLGLERPMFGMRGPGAIPFFYAGILSFKTLVQTLIAWLYFALMEASKCQGTLGKMALGIIVTDMAGQPITFGRATGRHFGKIISSYFTLWIGYMMAGWTQQKQALHDMMASCLVLRKR